MVYSVDENIVKFSTGRFKCTISRLLKYETDFMTAMDCESDELKIKIFFHAIFGSYFPKFEIRHIRNSMITMEIHNLPIILMFKRFLSNLEYLKHFEVSYNGFPAEQDLEGSKELYEKYLATITFDLLENGDIHIKKLEKGIFRIKPKPIPIIGMEIDQLEKIPISDKFEKVQELDINQELVDSLRTFLNVYE